MNLTNAEFEARGLKTKVAGSTYSFLSPSEIAQVRKAVNRAYPEYSAADKRRRVITIACQPTTAARFIRRVDEVLGAAE